MSDIPHADLLEDIRAHCALWGIPPTKFGMDAVGDPSFVSALENGRDCRSKTVRKVRAFMAATPDVRAAE